MEKHAIEFYEHYELTKEELTEIELLFANTGFISAIITFLEISEDGKLSLEDLIKAHNISAWVVMERRNGGTTKN